MAVVPTQDRSEPTIVLLHQAIDQLSAAMLEVQVALRSLDREGEADRDGIVLSLGHADRDLHQLATTLEAIRNGM